MRPFYSLVSSIFADELGHVELVSNRIALPNNGAGDPTSDTDISKAPFHANAAPWNMDMMTTTGNLIIDLLHNFHLACGARIHKLRVYETMKEPTGREVCAYLRVRGSLHAHAYALALKKITGVAIEQMLPTPRTSI